MTEGMGGDINLTRGTRIRITRDLYQALHRALQANEDHVVFESATMSERGDVTLTVARGTGRILAEVAGDEEIRPS